MRLGNECFSLHQVRTNFYLFCNFIPNFRLSNLGRGSLVSVAHAAVFMVIYIMELKCRIVPASLSNFAIIQAVTEVISLGLHTTVFPAAIAGAILKVKR